jgi:ADP-ribose pyrophosphatase YjhB (NUDIX family)
VTHASPPADRDLNAPIIRPAARAVIIDAADRVLLFAGINDDGLRFWYPPGGAIEAGESPEEAVRRELREETGLSDIVLQGVLGRRHVVVSWGGVRYECREQWFMAQVPVFVIDTSGMADYELTMVDDYRWWTVEELTRTGDVLAPSNLAALVRDVLQHGPPPQPIEMGL